ncbi:fibronectin type III domain-containing protein [candidate division TA06 bacterium]|uniref:Fibronectin type III domain-containing protein n=1 Tax=candidate division TA06 bacterium TaxID=2250710 RepID=A0A933I942_UNCT6|nr:fibronectin type III domain-containing protein [candidate division TA06 bacterium]
MGKLKMVFLACLLLPVLALGLEPPTDLILKDAPNDDGSTVIVKWKLSASENEPSFAGYNIERSEFPADSFKMIAWVPKGTEVHEDNSIEVMGQSYYYRIAAVTESGDSALSAIAGPIATTQSWFNTGKLNTLFGTVLFISITILYIFWARRGNLFIRRIAGLDAVEEAVGRATEMGKPILYCNGIGLIDYISTVASLNILAQVTKKIAQYDTPITVPTADPVVHAVAREMVKEGYNSAGRPDLFKEDGVYFITSDQMGYAAALAGIMSRATPATNFFMGYYAAESLVLAESGAATGAIQIAGTDQISQLPFFITACDYTLIGEELYAASAYLSKEPLLVGSLKGQDACKLLIVFFVLFGTIWAVLFHSDFIYKLFSVN